MKNRWCRGGQHFRDDIEFRTVDANGRLSPICMLCEGKRKPPDLRFMTVGELPARTDGVDIDAIHYARGAVRK